MDAAVLSKLEHTLEPLGKLTPLVRAVWIYGSFVKAEKYDPANDIDILVVVDDSRTNYNPEFMTKLMVYLKILEETAKKDGMKLHFQPPKELSFLWELIRHGEPWVLTSFRSIHPIVDPAKFAERMHSLITERGMLSWKWRSERLAETAYEKYYVARDILLKKIPLELFLIVVQCAQGILSYYGEYPMSPKATLEAMHKTFKDQPQRHMIVETFDELFILTDKINRGVLVEFTGQDFDRLYLKISEFVIESEGMISSLERTKTARKIERVYTECKQLCERALSRTRKTAGRSAGSLTTVGDAGSAGNVGSAAGKDRRNEDRKEEELLKAFKKEFVDSGAIDEHHYETLKQIFDYHKELTQQPDKVDEERHTQAKRIQMAYVKSLELALEDISSSEAPRSTLSVKEAHAAAAQAANEPRTSTQRAQQSTTRQATKAPGRNAGKQPRRRASR